jgi:hypothetical protein
MTHNDLSVLNISVNRTSAIVCSGYVRRDLFVVVHSHKPNYMYAHQAQS